MKKPQYKLHACLALLACLAHKDPQAASCKLHASQRAFKRRK